MSIEIANAQPGVSLPAIRFGPITRQMLALFAGASGDHNPAHIDIDFAKQAGLDDVFVHGLLLAAPMIRVATDWAGLNRLETTSVRFLSVTPVGAEMLCEGRVEERFEEDGTAKLRISLSSTIKDGPTNLSGEAIVTVA